MFKNSASLLSLLLLCSCSVSLLPTVVLPKKVVLNVPNLDQPSYKDLGKLSPIYLSGAFVAEPYRSSKIYDCEGASGLVSTGYEWQGALESQLESELDKVLREAFPSISFVSKESGSYAKSDLSIKVYKFCITESDQGMEMRLKMLLTLRSSSTRDQITRIFDFSHKEAKEVPVSDLLNLGFAELFKDLTLWLSGVSV